MTIYSQPSTITSSLRALSDDVTAILAATRATVTAARQRAQDTARALEQEQAVIDAVER
jgi:ABC-type transporter Mla subunit MlaD